MGGVADARDIRWMRLALSLGRRGMGRTWPNPAVGCVIVDGNRVLGRGWTADGGRPHAEPMALAQAGAAARGATAYVSLEPCSHHGQTPPCADALISAGIARVVCATTDPDPRVGGRGIARLREAGVEVTSGVLEAQAKRDHAGFFLRQSHGRPMVTLKLAMSLDGRIATASGESQWITGPEARARGHLLRSLHDAVLVGRGTVEADDPSLTVRGLGIAHQPIRVVADSTLATPLDSELVTTARQTPVWLCHTSEANAARSAALEAAGAVCIDCGDSVDGRLCAPAMLTALGAQGLTRVYCEGGGQLAASLLRGDLVDELAVFSAGLTLGDDGLPGVAALGLTALADAARFDLMTQERVGADLLSVWVRDRR